jgi:hypothetical protein
MPAPRFRSRLGLAILLPLYMATAKTHELIVLVLVAVLIVQAILMFFRPVTD